MKASFRGGRAPTFACMGGEERGKKIPFFTRWREPVFITRTRKEETSRGTVAVREPKKRDFSYLGGNLLQLLLRDPKWRRGNPPKRGSLMKGSALQKRKRGSSVPV